MLITFIAKNAFIKVIVETEMSKYKTNKFNYQVIFLTF